MIASIPAGRMQAGVVDRSIDPAALLRAVADVTAGATAVFLGTVRDTHDGRPVTGIDYQAYSAMADRQLHAIVAEASQRYGTRAIAVEHRVGYLSLGETSVAIAAAHERRAPAFAAARFVIEEIKRRVPIWKREHYVDGSREWVDPTRTVRVPTSPDGGAPIDHGAPVPASEGAGRA
jgi:molybdopterin synthase catalytic subunit